VTDRSYLRVRWNHSSPDDPVDLWSELTSDRQEIRKVEIWANGQIGYAGPHGDHGGTRIGEEALPTFDEIAADPQFRPQVVSAAAFEDCWTHAVAPSVTRMATMESETD
jgi:hypothetical protein